jgi:hypothetical protein
MGLDRREDAMWCIPTNSYDFRDCHELEQMNMLGLEDR